MFLPVLPQRASRMVVWRVFKLDVLTATAQSTCDSLTSPDLQKLGLDSSGTSDHRSIRWMCKQYVFQWLKYASVSKLGERQNQLAPSPVPSCLNLKPRLFMRVTFFKPHLMQCSRTRVSCWNHQKERAQYHVYISNLTQKMQVQTVNDVHSVKYSMFYSEYLLNWRSYPWFVFFLCCWTKSWFVLQYIAKADMCPQNTFL